ncbi:MAG: hypothetical protein ACLS3M_09595 [Collinsella sp.]
MQTTVGKQWLATRHHHVKKSIAATPRASQAAVDAIIMNNTVSSPDTSPCLRWLQRLYRRPQKRSDG